MRPNDAEDGHYRVAYIARAGIIAALYVILVYFFRPISFGPGQIRVAEALAVLPFFEAAAVPGLFVGCFLANFLGGMGVYDIVGGSTITLVAAYLTNRASRIHTAMLPPVILNAFGVSAYLTYISRVPYWALVGQIMFGQVIAVGGIGGLLAITLARTRDTLRLRRHY